MIDHELRRSGIGGSEIGAIVGLSPFSNALEIWGLKTRRIQERESTLPMELGTYLEPFIGQQYSNRTGFSLKQGQTIQHPALSWMIGSPDYYVLGQSRGLECKYTGHLDPELWGDERTDLVPIYFVAQCQWYMHLTSLPLWDLAVMAPRDFRIYHLPYDAEVANMLVEAGERFWIDHVLADEAPPIDASDAAGRYLRSRYAKQSVDEFVKADKEAEVWSDTLQMVKGQLKPLEDMKIRAEHELKLRIGDAAGIEGEGFSHTWKQSKPSKSIDWQALALHLGATPDVIAKYTSETPGSRRFIPKWTESEEE